MTGPNRGMFDIHLPARERPWSSDLLSPALAGGMGSGIASGGTGWSVSTCRTEGGATAIGGGKAGAVVGDAAAGTPAEGTGAGGNAVSCSTGRAADGGNVFSCGTGRTTGAGMGCGFAPSVGRRSSCFPGDVNGSGLLVTRACRTASSHCVSETAASRLAGSEATGAVATGAGLTAVEFAAGGFAVTCGRGSGLRTASFGGVVSVRCHLRRGNGQSGHRCSSRFFGGKQRLECRCGIGVDGSAGLFEFFDVATNQHAPSAGIHALIEQRDDPTTQILAGRLGSKVGAVE